MKEIEISKTIIEIYAKELLEALENDVIIVGSGPAGLTAAYFLAKAKIKTVVFEKRLSIGGGIWGGAAGYNKIIIENEDILKELEIRFEKHNNLYVCDSIEFATTLGYQAKKAGAKIFNLIQVEDIILKDKEIKGVVLNNAAIKGLNLHVDPFCVAGKYIIDATGHPAEIINMLKRKIKNFHPEEILEGFMDVEKSEAAVVKKTGEVYPRVYVAGMAVCAFYNLPRMGPIFGGMLKSGKKAAELIKNRIIKENINKNPPIFS